MPGTNNVMQNKNLTGKVALVTGSSHGIGAEIAKRLSTEGMRVALHGRDMDALSSVRLEIEQAGGEAIQVRGDVTRFSEIEALRLEIESKLGPVEILVANAGGNFSPPGVPFEEISEEGWNASIQGNLTATFLTLKSFLPGMKQRKSGNIVTISSAAGRRAHASSPIAYSIAKAGIQLLTQDLALQAGPFGIRVNCIAPETIMTAKNQRMIPAEQQEKLVAAHAIKRLGTPTDVADAVLFLASESSGWVTGIVLDVAGGAVMT